VQFTTAQHTANKPHDEYASLRKNSGGSIFQRRQNNHTETE